MKNILILSKTSKQYNLLHLILKSSIIEKKGMESSCRELETTKETTEDW